MLTGNREFNEIYEEYKNLVLKAAYIHSGNNYDAAQDITQDTFLKLYIEFDDFESEKIPRWLYTVACHEAFNFRRKHKREILADDEMMSVENEPSRESVEEEYLAREMNLERGSLSRRILEDLMEKNPRWHEAILLVYYMEVPQTRAAELLGIRIGVLHSMLHRAREWIKKTYGVEYEEMKRKE